MSPNDLITNIQKIHTTELGKERIRKNLSLSCEDVVSWCIEKITSPNCKIELKGKNYYAETCGVIIPVNAYSFTIITAHRIK